MKKDKVNPTESVSIDTTTQVDRFDLEQQIMQINGALQQCQWTLAELEKEEAPAQQEE